MFHYCLWNCDQTIGIMYIYLTDTDRDIGYNVR